MNDLLSKIFSGGFESTIAILLLILLIMIYIYFQKIIQYNYLNSKYDDLIKQYQVGLIKILDSNNKAQNRTKETFSKVSEVIKEIRNRIKRNKIK